MSLKSSLRHEYALFKTPAGSLPVLAIPLWGWVFWLFVLPLLLIGALILF